MYASSPRITHVCPELDFMAEYLPKVATEAYSLHQRNPIIEVDKLAFSA